MSEIKQGKVDVKDMLARMNSQTPAQSQPKELAHGDYTEDGGIVVERGHEEKKQVVESGVAKAIHDKFIEMDNAIHLAKTETTLEETVSHKPQLDESEKQALTEIEQRAAAVKNAFKDVDVTAKGLSSKDDPNVQRFKNAANDLINGRVELPKSVEESKELLRQSNINKNNSEIIDAEPQYEEVAPSTPQLVEPVKTTGDNITINVAPGASGSVLASLPIEQRDKVETASKIIINEIETKDVPVATRRITSLDEFRAVRPKAANIKPMELMKVTLVNSGLVLEVNGAGAMELITILPDDEVGVDYHKRYTFCHKHTINTSIGKLSFSEFVSRIHPEDLPTIIHGILTVSYPETDTMEIICGGAQCGARYNVEYRMGDLLDIENLDPKTLERAEAILTAYTESTEASKEIHESMPIRQQKFIKLSDTITIKLTTMNGVVMINRFNLLDSIRETHNSFVSLMMLYADKVLLTMQGVNDSKPEVYEIVDTFVIANLISELSDEECIVLKNALTTLLEDEVPPLTYSIRGDFVCPNCGKKETSIAIGVDSMVFSKVRKALM